VTSNNRWITTLAARFGVTNGSWLFYGKAGGGGVGSDDFTVTNLTTGASFTGFNNNTNTMRAPTLLLPRLERMTTPSFSPGIIPM
jgi:hypothetical protein